MVIFTVRNARFSGITLIILSHKSAKAPSDIMGGTWTPHVSFLAQSDNRPRLSGLLSSIRIRFFPHFPAGPEGWAPNHVCVDIA
jgi:hypothetical protein